MTSVNRPQKGLSLSEENAQSFKDDHCARLLPLCTRQVPNENTKKGVSTIHECGLCGTVDALREYVSCFMFYSFAFTCYIHILEVTERPLHALPRNRACDFLLGAKRSSLGAVWAFLLDFRSFLMLFEVTKNPVAISTALRPFGTWSTRMGRMLPYCRTSVLLHHCCMPAAVDYPKSSVPYKRHNYIWIRKTSHIQLCHLKWNVVLKYFVRLPGAARPGVPRTFGHLRAEFLPQRDWFQSIECPAVHVVGRRVLAGDVVCG